MATINSVRDGGLWKACLTAALRPEMRDGGVWKDVRAMWVASTVQVSDDPPTFETTWILIRSWDPPTLAMTSVSLVAGPGDDPPQVTLSWAAFSDPDVRETYSVNIDWYVNGSFSFNESVDQSDNEQIETFSPGDEVHAIVNYFNENGAGPTTETDHIFL